MYIENLNCPQNFGVRTVACCLDKKKVYFGGGGVQLEPLNPFP